MPLSLLPKYQTESITSLTQDLLRARGIALLMLDFDNTIVPYTSDTPTQAVAAWLAGLKDWDIPVCVVSNSRKDRVGALCRAWGLDYVTHARKPFSKGIRECLARYGVPAHQAALAGDQIFTDTLGANCAGAQSILVRAIDNYNTWLKVRHVLELPFIFLARDRRI